MAKKLGRNGNGEGSVYNTIQKEKKKFDNSKMCPICAECTDRSFCSNRTNIYILIYLNNYLFLTLTFLLHLNLHSNIFK